MEAVATIPDHVIFRNPSKDNFGSFILHKSIFVVDGVNTTYSGRCDNLTYSMELPTHRTNYHDEGIYLGETSPYTGHPFTPMDGQWLRILDATPYFCITFVFCTQKLTDGSTRPADYILTGDFPGSLWFGKSIVELLKNMREWTFMLDEPFNSDHPMATYSKMAFDFLETPQYIYDELDSMPDMHLARFLKGDTNHREIYNNYPQMSEEMMNWFKEKLDQFPIKTTNQRLTELSF
jgi:hypothetical protein